MEPKDILQTHIVLERWEREAVDGDNIPFIMLSMDTSPGRKKMIRIHRAFEMPPGMIRELLLAAAAAEIK